VVRGAKASAEATIPPLAQLTVQAIGFEVTWPSGGSGFWQVSPAAGCARPSPGPARQEVSNANAVIIGRHGKQETVFLDVLH
jgi:hypothetical protein